MTLTPPRFHIADDMPMSLGKAIARAIAPKVDPNAWFDAVARQYPDDKPPKAARTVEDVLSDPTEDEMQYIIKLRGGCRCSWPNAAPPCGICTTEYSEEEAAEALAECSQQPAPPSVQKFRVGDRVRPSEAYADASWKEAVVTRITCDGAMVWAHYTDKSHETWCGPRWLELISPASETETEGDGWIEWKGGECPIPDAAPESFEVKWTGGGVDCYQKLTGRQVAGWEKGGGIVAYRVVKP